MSTRPEDLRSDVAKAYGERVAQPASGRLLRRRAAQKGAVVEFAGYTADELAELPDDAVVNSFGCGNPVALAGLRKGDVVLDLGSGAGIDLLLAARLVGPEGRVIGVDMTDEMIARAEANIAAAGLANVEVRKGIIEELPVEDASVDWVISNCVINLSPEKERVFAEIARVLRPGRADAGLRHRRREPPAGDPRAAGRLLVVHRRRHQRGTTTWPVCAPPASPTWRSASGSSTTPRSSRASPPRPPRASAAAARSSSAELVELVRGYARGLEGQVWSAKVYARKPA